KYISPAKPSSLSMIPSLVIIIPLLVQPITGAPFIDDIAPLTTSSTSSLQEQYIIPSFGRIPTLAFLAASFPFAYESFRVEYPTFVFNIIFLPFYLLLLFISFFI